MTKNQMDDFKALVKKINELMIHYTDAFKSGDISFKTYPLINSASVNINVEFFNKSDKVEED